MADGSEHGSERTETTAPQQCRRLLHIQLYSRTSQVRQDIMNADVLMFRGDGILSGLIQAGTDSPYSHSGIVFRSDVTEPFRTAFGPGRVCVVEAVGTGIRMGLLSETVENYHGAIELWRLRPDLRAGFDAARSVAEARRYIGRPYAFALLFWFVLDWLTLKQFDLRSRTCKRQALFCSQLVSRAYVEGGVDLCKCYEDAATSPADLIGEHRIEPVHAFSKQDPLLVTPTPTTDAGCAQHQA